MVRSRLDFGKVNVLILENFDYLTELIPLGSSWETLRIHDCITTSEELKERFFFVENSCGKDTFFKSSF